LLKGNFVARSVMQTILWIALSQWLIACAGGDRFTNSDGQAINKSLVDLLQWRAGRQQPAPIELPRSDDWKGLNSQSTQYAVWIGHATYLLNNGDLTIITDPIFSRRASPVSWAGPERMVDPAIALTSLPPIDVVLVSHNHYDHLDIPSLLALQENHPTALFLVPKGDLALLKSAGIERVEEYDWWQSRRVERTVFTFTPAHHWSARGLLDRNRSLWGGWYMAAPERTLYHAGDTGYSSDFSEIRQRLGAPDFAFIPIGAYAPRWFMAAAHVDPDEALQIAEDVGAGRAFAMHWGTFILTDEPIAEPQLRLREALKDAGRAEDFFITPILGGINPLVD
jgi:N-acyl-phosphatidylethanolamine-hydrolysing phospholipase D